MLLPLVLAACALITDADLARRMDLDGDRVPRPTDCDDDDPAVTVREFHADGDSDGFGGPAAVSACTAPDGFVANADDCNDADATVTTLTWYEDGDGDGYTGSAISACAAPDGATAEPTDCNDADAAISPAAAEIWYDGVDENCDGWDDDDADLDGYPNADEGGTDCDDGDAAINPGEPAKCGDVDNNCDGRLAGECGLIGERSVDDADAVISAPLDELEYGFGELEIIGDANGDGYDDLVVANQWLGIVWRLDGPLSGAVDVATAGARVDLCSESGYYEMGVVGVGDADGDGLDDWAIGALDADSSNAYVVTASAAATCEPGLQLAGLGLPLAGGGDTDGDGALDILFGTGSVVVARGPFTSDRVGLMASTWTRSAPMRRAET